MKRYLAVLLLVLSIQLSHERLAPFTPVGGPRKIGLPYYGTPDFLPQWQVVPHQVGPLSFIDQAGKELTEESLEGKITVVNFFFIGCSSMCPTLMGNLQNILPNFAADQRVQLISISVTPQLDEPGELQAYAQARHLDPRWRLLHGSTEVISALARESLFCADDLRLANGSREVLHTEKVFLLDGQRHIRGLYNGSLPLEVDKLVGDIRSLL